MESSSNSENSPDGQCALSSHNIYNYGFSQENLDDIPHPDDSSCKQQKPITMLLHPDDLELPPFLPEQTSSKSLPEPKVPEPCNPDEFLFPAQIPLPEDHFQKFTVPALRSDTNADQYVFLDIKKKSEEEPANTEMKTPGDSARYSPSKMDSDEESQDFITIKPKVLGKEQAKKRLMAFSLSKQPTCTVKKQNKIASLPKNIKEKPPNPNKSTGVQDQFRATISEIEEEKKRMMQNMPNYLLLEMSDLAKATHPIITSSLKLLEKHKAADAEMKDAGKKEDENVNKSDESRSQENKESGNKSKQRSKSPNRSYERTRSRSRERKYNKKSRDSSKSRRRKRRSRSRSSVKKSKDKYIKQDKKNSDNYPKKKDLHEDWKSFKASGFTGISDIWNTILQREESEKERDREYRWSPSPSNDRRCFKPIFNYLKQDQRFIKSFQARSVDSRSSNLVVFTEKNIKYTKTKPMLIWSENPSVATEFYMSRQMLLDNCDSDAVGVLNFILHSEVNSHHDDFNTPVKSKIREWYSDINQFLRPPMASLYDEFQVDVPKGYEKSEHKANKTMQSFLNSDDDKVELGNKIDGKKDTAFINEDRNGNEKNEKWDTKKGLKERRINLVNDTYKSDEEKATLKLKEMVMGDVKVQMNLDMNCVKVRSRWDSDYECEESDNEDGRQKDNISGSEPEIKLGFADRNVNLSSDISKNDYQEIKPAQQVEKREPDTQYSKNEAVVSNVPCSDKAGNLASEYEEFLKMVSFEFDSGQPVENKDKSYGSGSKIEKTKSSNNKTETGKQMFELTDWDKDSDHEGKTINKTNSRKNGSEKEFLLENEKVGPKQKKSKKTVLSKKKALKLKTEKLTKRAAKEKKKRQGSSSSTESSSDSYDSDSDSISDWNDSTLLKKKKKKVRKTKKKYKKQSSSSSSDSESDSSDSDSDDSKSKKRKGKKKREKKKKKDGSNKSEDERESILLKELDIKKQIIMKKIEEIDSISERNGKKKTKERKSKKREKENIESAESPGKYSKSRKRKKTDVKGEKNKKGKFSSRAEKENKGTRKKNFSSDSSEENSNKVKSKKKVKKVESKKDRDITKSSDSDLDKEEEKDNRSAGTKRSKSHEKTVKKVKKNKKLKKKSYSSSNTDSDSSPAGENDKPKKKKVRSKEDDENTNCGWKDDFMMDDDFRKEKNRSSLSGGKSEWKESKKKSNEKVKKNLKDNGDWEASSSEESLSDSKSRESWEEAPCNDKKITKTEVLKEKFDKNIDFKNSEKSSSDRKPPNESDKDNSLNSFSNFSFGFEPELSRDFLLTTHGYSNSEPLMGNQDYGNMDIERRLPSSVSQSNDQTKPTKSELYSPGHSDSDVSENERVENTEKTKSSRLTTRDEKYDPLNSESESSLENDEDINTIPLPRVSSTSLPSETKMSDMKTLTTPEITSPTNVDHSHGIGFSLNVPANGSPKFKMKSINFTPSQLPSSVTNSFVEEADKIAVKKQLMSVKSQPKLKSKAAAVFQEDSDESNSDITEKPKEISPAPVTDVEKTDRMPEETSYKSKSKEHDSEKKKSTKTKSDEKKPRKRERSKERTDDKDRKKRSSSRERRSSSKSTRAKVSSPLRRRKSRSPEFIPQTPKKESKREIRSDSFEIEPLKSAAEYQDLEETIQPIPVLTGLGVASSEQTTWTRSHFPGYTSNELTSGSGQLIDPSESFDIYPSEDSAYPQKNTDKVSSGRLEDSVEKTKEKKEIRRSRSRSMSPRKRRRSKSPEKRKKSRSPRRRSKSPKRRGRSPYSPRRKSPKRKSPSRRYRSSRSPDRRRKSRSRSPRKRRASPGRRSHSASPRGHRCDSPRRRSSPSRGYSPRGSLSPRRDSHFSSHFSSSFHNRIPVIGGGSENLDPELSPSSAIANPMGFSHQPPGFNDSDMNNSYYNPDYTGEFGTTNYPEEIGVNNLITLKNPDVDKTNSPERLSLDQRIELELGVPMNNQGPGDQYQKGQFQEVNFQSSYNCEDGNAGQEPFYPTHNVPMNSEYNSSYYNGQPPPQPGYGSFQQYPNSQGSMLQVGNNVEVVPSMQHSHSSPAVPAKNSCHQIMQVGNVLQVVPSQKSSQGSPMPFHGQNYGPPGTSPVPSVKTQKATAVVAPSSIVPQQNPEAMINPLIKAIQLEREKRKLEKKKRKDEREARRKARQLRREAKLMSVNEKLKKSVQDEGLMLGQEVEDDELLDGLDLPSPPIPVEIITVSSPSALPPAGKGILITAGFMPKPPSEKKEVKFADGVLPGEGTSSSGEEDIASPPPKPKLPKEKRYKKKKMKVKKKVKVQIIKEIIQDEDEDDDLSPPPPPPGSPPPIYFARFPFAGDAQFPVYQMQTTTTTLTTVQYATPTF